MKRAWLLLFVAANVVTMGAFWWWNASQGVSPEGDQALMACGRLAGLLAALSALLQLVFICRAPWAEQAFGLDHLTRLHKYNGFLLVFLVIAHGSMITLQYAGSRDEGILETVRGLAMDQEGVFAAMLAAGLLITIALFSVAVIRRKLAYETWYFIHVTAYVAIALAMGHQVESGGDFTANTAFAWYWYALYAFVAANLLGYRLGRPGWWFVRHRFEVEKVVRETPEVTSVYIAGRGMERFRIAAGQFMIVRFLARGMWWQAHPFSLSCGPNDTHVRISVRSLGDFTARVKDIVPGTRVVIDGPNGVFTARRLRREKVLLVAGGIGITPLRALAEELCERKIETVLLYASRKGSAIVFKDELDTLASHGTMRIHHVISDDPSWDGEQGFIDAARITRLVPDVVTREAFVCGPPPMMRSLVRTLRALGIPRKAVHYEYFAF